MDPARVLAALPELDAVSRRALALTLAGVPRAGVASELGLAGGELSDVLAKARKALRRTRAELPSAGRCERAERALSDLLDGATSSMDERFLVVHQARCARCRTHAAELDAATVALQAQLAERPRLRLVPPEIERIDVQPPSAPAHPAPASPTLVEEAVVAPTPAPHQSRARAALPIAVAALIAIGLIAAAIALLGYRHDDNNTAPWNAPNAPVVQPAPISAQ